VRIDCASTKPTTTNAAQHREQSSDIEAGWSLCYSGDCRPSEALAELGRGATVCIHEASFGDDMQVREDEEEDIEGETVLTVHYLLTSNIAVLFLDLLELHTSCSSLELRTNLSHFLLFFHLHTLKADAVSKRHSTVSEAVALSLGTMQVHRCVLTHFSQRYPKLPDLPPRVSSRVLVACDLLSVTLGQLAWAPAAVLPVLRCLFSSSDDDDEEEKATDAAAVAEESKPPGN
jgi:hypothetical protein